MKVFVPTILVISIMLVPVLLFICTILLFRWIDKRKKQRSPLTSQLLRMPGESLLRELDEIQGKLHETYLWVTTMPIMLYAGFISELCFGDKKSSTSSNLTISFTTLVEIYFIIIIGILLFAIFKAIKIIRKRRNLQLGFECEVAVGQELNQLMQDGYYVYHDFLADKFNIDHIVIGSGGVFAVETKGRTKPTSKNASVDARVFYNGECLKFPHKLETQAIEQSKKQAKWLADFLNKAVGEPVKTIPVVTLPGWFVQSDEKGGKYYEVRVINPKVIVAKLKEYQPKNPLSKELVTRIAYQIEQRCRNVEPKAYVATNPRY